MYILNKSWTFTGISTHGLFCHLPLLNRDFVYFFKGPPKNNQQKTTKETSPSLCGTDHIFAKKTRKKLTPNRWSHRRFSHLLWLQQLGDQRATDCGRVSWHQKKGLFKMPATVVGYDWWENMLFFFFWRRDVTKVKFNIRIFPKQLIVEAGGRLSKAHHFWYVAMLSFGGCSMSSWCQLVG